MGWGAIVGHTADNKHMMTSTPHTKGVAADVDGPAGEVVVRDEVEGGVDCLLDGVERPAEASVDEALVCGEGVGVCVCGGGGGLICLIYVCVCMYVCERGMAGGMANTHLHRQTRTHPASSRPRAAG